MVECLIFGALISSFNPNSVFTVYGDLSVDPNLHVLVYGEYCVKNAICIAVYNALSKFLLTPMSVLGVFNAIWTFLVMIVGSFVFVNCYFYL